MSDPIRALLLDQWALVPYYAVELTRALSQDGVAVTLCSMTYDFDPGCFVRAGVENDPGLLDLVGQRRIGPPAIRRGFKLLQGSINLAAMGGRIVYSRPHVFHVQQLRLFQESFPLEVWLLNLARMLGSRLVYTVHNLVPHDTGRKLTAAYANLYRRMDALICHSDDIKARLLAEFGCEDRRVWVIPHGPLFQTMSTSPDEIGRARPLSADNPCVVLCHGMIRPYTGIPFLLEAWKRIQDSGRNARLIIAGTGETTQLETVRDCAAGLSLGASVEFDFRFLPPGEMAGLYGAADILVYPYREITSSGSLMTGVSRKRAIIATDLEPFRKILIDDQNAKLVRYGDVDGLAGALALLIDHPEERDRLASGLNLLSPEILSWSSIAQQTRRCYESVLMAAHALRPAEARDV